MVVPVGPLRKEPQTPEHASAGITLPALLQDWKGAHERALGYLAALGRDGAGIARIAVEAIQQAASRPAWPPGADAYIETFAALRRILVGTDRRANDSDAASAFLESRIAELAGGGTPEVIRAFSRGRMVSQRLEWRGWRRSIVSARGEAPAPAISRGSLAWVRASRRRRALLALLVLIPSLIASGFMTEVLPHQGRTLLEAAIVLFFGALFGWISIGFWTSLAGFLVLLLRRDRFLIVSVAREATSEPDPGVRTAIVMPIYQEPVDRVFAGLRSIYLSLERSGSLEGFDFFVLSDTADPGLWVKEEEAWLRWCREVGGFGRIFYRRRRVRVKRKSGNIADFCRRFGRQYRYMVTLDADSVMSGEAIHALVAMMEARPDVGLVQTVPAAVRSRTLYSRIQQFANRVYGPLFTAGFHFWQLGDSQYWGHNAILRMAPFMEHCALPRLPGKPPLGGEILSHDFVESALMGRAGFSTWIAYDLPGSFEEIPSSLLEDLQRDRRWCQGNLQHLHLVFVRGLLAAHRAIFLNGVFSYVSAMLWFAFLALSTVAAILQVVREPDYFPSGPSLFPEWPVWRPDWALSLLSVTLVILFVPKILSALLVLLRSGGRSFGGPTRFLLGILFEVLASSLLAPIRMVFHTKFVLTNLLGRTVSWRSPPRGAHETAWTEALQHHGAATIVAIAWGASVYWLNPDYFWWLTPIMGALALSVPLSVLASRVRLGDAARRAGLFLTPEEIAPPRELLDLDAGIEANEAAERELPPLERDGFVRAIVDPFVNAVHRRLLREARSVRPSVRADRRALVADALAGGPAALDVAARSIALSDPETVEELHRRVWELPEIERARLWGRPGGGRFTVV